MGRSKDASLRPEALFDIILSVTSPFRSTDPRDKVFAVLAMIDQLSLSLKQTSIFIRVDYTMPAVEVYYEAAKAIVNGTQSLALLSRHVDAPTCELTGLPSWVPDFSTHRGVPMMNVNWTQETTKFNAALNNSTTPPSFIVDDMLLTCNCHRLGIVEDVGEPVHDMFSKGCFEESAKLTLKQDAVYVTGQGRIEVLWRTLIADSSPDQYPAPSKLAKSFYTFVKITLGRYLDFAKDGVEAHLKRLPNVHLLSRSENNSLIPTLDMILEQEKTLKYLSQNNLPAFQLYRSQLLREFHILVSTNGVNRRLFRTQQGYLGLGPQSLEVGDSIWIISDTEIPFAFRKVQSDTTNRCQLVGEAYVHGFMHGEAFKDVEPIWEPIVFE